MGTNIEINSLKRGSLMLSKAIIPFWSAIKIKPIVYVEVFACFKCNGAVRFLKFSL